MHFDQIFTNLLQQIWNKWDTDTPKSEVDYNYDSYCFCFNMMQLLSTF